MLYLPVHITGVSVSALVDTGASRSFVSVEFTEMTQLHVHHDVLMVIQLPTGRGDTTDYVLYSKLLIESVPYS